MIKNGRDIFSVRPSNGDIPTLHGIRFLNTILLIISHKCMEIDFNPISNKREMNLLAATQLSTIVRSSYLYTDAFIMISGMLVAYSFIGRLQRGQKINIPKEIAGRYIRIFPPVAALMLFGTFILPFIGSGPQWNMLITYQSELCKTTWWRNVLMIHNWFGFENVCMTHTHHVGTDFELFLVAPFLIIFLYKYPKHGILTISGLAAIATIARFYTVFVKELSVFVLFGGT